VFHATLGESIGRFITRRRLELAALRLAYEPDATITAIALDCGYSSSAGQYAEKVDQTMLAANLGQPWLVPLYSGSVWLHQ
jgi:AraC-like DNA-binding protein